MKLCSKCGRPMPKLTKEQRKRIVMYYESGTHTKYGLAKLYGVSWQTIHYYIKKAEREEQNK